MIELVRQWIDGKYQNQGFFLRTTGGGGTIVFCSREHAEADHRPRLIVVGDETVRSSWSRRPTRILTKSTYRSQGTSDELRVSGGPGQHAAPFRLDRPRKAGTHPKATLRLYTTRQYGDADIGVFRCQQGHDLPPSDPILGLAARYPGDQGIAKTPDVVFATDFESERVGRRMDLRRENGSRRHRSTPTPSGSSNRCRARHCA